MIFRHQHGLTLVEILVAMVLLAIVIVPAVHALHTGIIGADVHADVAANHYRISARIEELLSEPFENLVVAANDAGSPTIPSSYSDPAGPPNRLIVYLSLYDGDNADADNDPFTGTDPGLLWLRVDVEDTIYTLQTVTGRGQQR